MNIRTIRRTSVTLPALDEPGLDLADVTSLHSGRGRVEEFRYGETELRDLDVAGTHLLDGCVTALRTQRTRLDSLRVDSVEFTGCDLSALRWRDSKATRTVFRDCKLMGAAMDDVTFDDVLFENCNLDYSDLTRVKATGPVIFTRCSLRETTFTAVDLGEAAFDDCDLRLATFNGGAYRGMDLRGNDLSQLRGLAHLNQVIIDDEQKVQLAEALVAELDISYGDDT